ncbi:cation-efflux pump [Anaerolineae bacterium CFX9]|nr:cation-efflux pump [Anaerolineae bacterium CFX9]
MRRKPLHCMPKIRENDCQNRRTPPIITRMTTNPTRTRVRQVLLVTLLLNLSVAIGKIIIGTVTGALSITADGFHSLMDGASNIFGLIASRIADQPPDADHPYGHRRFETLAALAIGVLLLITGWEIITSAVERLTTGSVPEVTPLTFIVLSATLVVNLIVSTWERREGRRLRSEILLADAANTSADVFVTLSVMISMVLVTLGLGWVDAVAALIVVALIGRAAWKIIRQNGGVLVDRAPYAPEILTRIVEAVPSVTRVVRARSRGSADAAHIDIDVAVAPQMTADHTAAIASAIRDALRQEFRGIHEVEVHFEPIAQGAPDYALTTRAQADALGLATHEVRVSEGENGKLLEMHVEVPPGQSLAEAHAQVTKLERSVAAELPEIAEIVTHIEPALKEPDAPEPDGLPSAEALIDAATALLAEAYPDTDWHHMRATPFAEGYALTMHAALPPDMTVEAAHMLAEAAELRLRSELRGLTRVTIHTEPYRSPPPIADEASGAEP